MPPRSRGWLLWGSVGLIAALGVLVIAPLYLMHRDPRAAVLAATTDDSYPWVLKSVAMAYLKHGHFNPNAVDVRYGIPMPLLAFACAGYGLGSDERRVLDVVKLLRDRGADLDSRHSGYTPLQAAVLSAEPVMVAHLLQLGSDAKLRVETPGKPYDGLTTLEFARYLFDLRPGPRREEILRLLVAAA